MADRKRQRSSGDDEEEDDLIISGTDDHPSKKPRKETNASARRSLFVRSLPATATSDAITELFSQNYPLKHATVVIDPFTKQSKGYGFVTFADAEDAQRALDEFQGHNFQGRKMKIEVAEPRTRIKAKSREAEGKKTSIIATEAAAAKKARDEKMAEDRKPPKLIIRNLPWSVKTPEQLTQLFQKFGKVKHATLPKVKDTQAGFGFVVMRGKKNAEKALATINGTLVDGRTLAVDWAVEKDIWEKQNKSSATEDPDTDAEKENEPEKAASENEDDDVANFMRQFGGELESEDDSEAENNEGSDDEDAEDSESEQEERKPKKNLILDNSSTLFVRNLPFTTRDSDLKEHFVQFGPVRYARIVMDKAMDRSKGTGFVCFFNVEDADACFRGAPRFQLTGANATKKSDGAAPQVKHSILEDENADSGGKYTIEGRVLQISKAVEKDQAVKLTEQGTNVREDRRRLYLLSEGTVAKGTALYDALAPSEVKMREDSAMQRKKLIQSNPTLHLSLTRLSIRNLPRNIDSKALKALAREAVVGFSKDVKAGLRAQLSKEEEARGGDEMREAEKHRKAKGKGIVRQSKVVFEGREGAKVSEESGAGRSRGYGFVEYSSHRWALMGLRWLNGHALESAMGKKQRLIVEFAIENAQVVSRRKEREEKARTRSKEVSEKIEKGEMPKKEKGKKVLSKDSLMAKTRKGMKGGKGRPDTKKEKSFEKVVSNGAGTKRKREDEDTEKSNKKGAKKDAATKEFKPGFPAGEEGRLARRAQIIQKKRTMRRNRKGGAA